MDIVATFLAEDDSFGTLSTLNILCKGIHQATLPKLYETMDVQKEDYFQRLEPSRVPKGSSILGELSLAALTSLVDRELHLRYLHLAHSASVRLDDSLRSGVWDDEKRPQEIDIITIFPRLVYRRSTSDRPPRRSGDFWPRRRWRDLSIELFKPIGIADLAEHASSRRWRNANDGHAVELPKTPLHLLDDVTELIIRKGGALRPSAPGVPSNPTPRPDLAEFDIAISLMIEEPIADDRTSATFDVILDLMALATRGLRQVRAQKCNSTPTFWGWGAICLRADVPSRCLCRVYPQCKFPRPSNQCFSDHDAMTR
jgi:hypothetical protein